MRILILLLFLATGLVSCKHHHGSSDDPLFKEVMAIHDEVMPKMSTMHKYKKELKKLRESNPAADNAILQRIALLETADEGMMSWMADFKVPEDKTAAKSYLEAEKNKIQQVSDDMYRSMDEAKKLIDSLQVK